MRRFVPPLLAALIAGTVLLAGTAAARRAPTKAPSGPKCSVQNAGGIPSSAALGGWSYEVEFSCPFALSSFRVQTNKTFVSGPDKFGTTVPFAYAELKSGQQANFTCSDSAAKSVTCTVSPTLPARTIITDGFDSSTACRNTKKGRFDATLTVNRRKTRVSFESKTTTGSLVGGCG
jgi:hypothetical protein